MQTNPKTVLKRELKELLHALAVLRDEREISLFFDDLCTPAELAALADRWRVVPLLKQGMSYRDIHEKTGVSVTTIGRVARALTYGAGGYDLVYQRLRRKK